MWLCGWVVLFSHFLLPHAPFSHKLIEICLMGKLWSNLVLCREHSSVNSKNQLFLFIDWTDLACKQHHYLPSLLPSPSVLPVSRGIPSSRSTPLCVISSNLKGIWVFPFSSSTTENWISRKRKEACLDNLWDYVYFP